MDTDLERTDELYKEAVEEGVTGAPLTTPNVALERDVVKAAML